MQSKLLQCPGNCCSRACLECCYIIDLVNYSANRLGFNEARRKAVGPTFCALGRVHHVSYDQTAAHLSNPQDRGPYLGRAALDADMFHPHFLLMVGNMPGQKHQEYVHRVARCCRLGRR